MSSKIIDRITSKIGVPGLVEILGEKLSSRELQSLLLYVFENKTRNRKALKLLKDYQLSRFTRISDVDPILHHNLVLKLISLLPAAFKCVDLAPVAPLGTANALGKVHQNNVISTIRNLEVSSDPTNQLALECAVRRQKLLQDDPKSDDAIKLSSWHHVTRAQPFEYENFSAHFNIFALCTAGRDSGGMVFETQNLLEHLRYYFNLIDQLIPPDEYKEIQLTFFGYEDIAIMLFNEVKSELPENNKLSCHFEANSNFCRNFYQRISFTMDLINPEGQSFNYISGGFTDWTAKLMNNKKERLLTSGIGTDFLLRTMKTTIAKSGL